MRLVSALWTVFAVIFLAGCNGEIRDFDITQYEKAALVGTLRQEKGGDKVRITTSAGVNVTVLLESINSVSLQFQDDKKERQIYQSYFICSAEIRQLRGKDQLYVRITSAFEDRFNEWYKEEKYLVYNLTTRKMIGWAKMSPNQSGAGHVSRGTR
jgi:hypothetical protein